MEPADCGGCSYVGDGSGGRENGVGAGRGAGCEGCSCAGFVSWTGGYAVGALVASEEGGYEC